MIQRRFRVRKLEVLMVASRKSIKDFIFYIEIKAPVVKVKE